MNPLDATDRALVAALGKGLPLVAEPYKAVADELGLAEADVIARLRRMMASGAIRRIAAVPNHYSLGMTANGMSVWDVADDRVLDLGAKVGALPFVTHCYRRPRILPDWRFNLFAMVHGSSRDEVEAKVGEIAGVLGTAARARDILDNWDDYRPKFVKVMPVEYRRALKEMEEQRLSAAAE